MKQINSLDVKWWDDRYDGLRIVIGGECLRKISYLRVFVIGAGAIGWELLMNCAILGVGTGKIPATKDGRRIVVIEPDHIENSNLNRQFLLRKKHINKPKATTAAVAAINMNPDLKDHIFARLVEVWTETEDIFSDGFFEKKTVVIIALGNVVARRYMDSQWVQARIPLIDGGTLGPKGNVKIVLPFWTESYSSSTDPEANT